MRSSVASAFASTDAGRNASHITSVPSRTSGTSRRARRGSRAVRSSRSASSGRRTSRGRGTDDRRARPNRNRPARRRARTRRSSSNCEWVLAGHRVVVLRERETELHRPEATGRRERSYAARRARVRRQRLGGPRPSACSTALADACGDALLDLHSDADHNRSVFTLAGPRSRRRRRPRDRTRAPRSPSTSRSSATPACTRGSVRSTSCRSSRSTPSDAREAAAAAARAFGAWWAETFRGAGVLLRRRRRHAAATLPAVRRDAFRAASPDVGRRRRIRRSARRRSARAGRSSRSTACSRPTTWGSRATIATRVRERDGGLPGVRALGFLARRRERAQVSMNLVDLDRTGVEAACTRGARRCATQRGTEVAAVELVGLAPGARARALLPTTFLALERARPRRRRSRRRLRRAGPAT